MFSHPFRAFLPAILAFSVIVLLTGCSGEGRFGNAPDASGPAEPDEASSPGVVNPGPPPDLVSVAFAGHDVTFWPYTGVAMDGTPVDPINIVLHGQVDPVQIRAALLALNGNRTAFGYPDAYPFNATWSDAIGDVQASYAHDDGWIGSVIQLQLGNYEPVRFHLRLFLTGERFGSGEWTLGAAHFELRIPGTADHQVLSWEKAEQIVMVDLLRSGLLDPAAPMAQTDPINEQPGFREIPAIIYNGLSVELRAFIEGPLGDVSSAVPIATNGRATILNVATAAPVVAGTASQSFTMTYGQVVPKPLCSSGPMDYVLVNGPVDFHKTVHVDHAGRISVDGGYSGVLTVTPWDVVTNTAGGESYHAWVGGQQTALESGRVHTAFAFDHKLSRQDQGVEILYSWLRVGAPGVDSYKSTEICR